MLCLFWGPNNISGNTGLTMRLSVMSILFDAQIYGIYESDEVCLILDFVPLLIWLTVWNFDELHKCKKNHAQGSCFGAEKPYGIGAWLLGPPRYLPFLNVFFSNDPKMGWASWRCSLDRTLHYVGKLSISIVSLLKISKLVPFFWHVAAFLMRDSDARSVRIDTEFHSGIQHFLQLQRERGRAQFSPTAFFGQALYPKL